MRVGYARVSSRHQSLDRQITALESYGCKEIFREKARGKTTRNRPQLDRALARLGKDDVFVVAEWDRATRSMMDGLALMTRIHAAGATIVVLDRKALDLTTPMGKGLLSLLSAVFEEERVRIRKRALKGIAEAKRRNKRFGRKPKLTAEEATSIRERLRQGDSYRQIARAFHVHHQTIARIAKQRGSRSPN
jgi:DNA invertase Pin-like site-specific DNA recombinase